MRTIQFRGKSKKTGVWLIGSYIKNRGFDFIAQDEFANGKTWEDYEVIPDTIGQFTGITDKNGKEIYEGDIIQSYMTRRCYTVFWNDKESAYMYKQPESLNTFSLIKRDVPMFSVIGNIHDNPELLKGGKERGQNIQ